MMNEGYMNKELLKKLGFEKAVDHVEHGFCPVCSEPVSIGDFRDLISKKEYEISGLCSDCQDDIFGE